MIKKKVASAAYSYQITQAALNDYTKDLIAIHADIPAIFSKKPQEMSIADKMQLGAALVKLDTAFKKVEE